MQKLTPAQQERLTALYFEGTHAVRAAALTGLHFEQVKAFYASWDKTKDKEAQHDAPS